MNGTHAEKERFGMWRCAVTDEEERVLFDDEK